MENIRHLVEKNGTVEVVLEGEDGNAFAIMGRVKRSLNEARWPREDVQQVLNEMRAGDYDHLLTVAVRVSQ